ncbi:MAG: FAD-binding oxidoreductase [Alphaproteobacteria bacterium]
MTLRFAGVDYDYQAGETVLDALLRQDVDTPYFCRNGICLSCILQCQDGEPTADSQQGIRDTLRSQGHFLPCLCTPDEDLDCAPPNHDEVYGRATFRRIEQLSPSICRVFLEPATPLYYRAGQFINLRREDGMVRSYSLASVPSLDEHLDLHIKRLPRGEMSNWLFHEAEAGDSLDIHGPIGNCFYVPERPEASLLLIGNGSGLAPLIGIVRDALASGHTGAIHLYHGTRHREGLYLDADLRALEKEHGNFTYTACVSGESGKPGRAENVAFAKHPALDGYRVYLCGYPPMVNAAQKSAYLMGANLDDIHADPFELRDLRLTARD